METPVYTLDTLKQVLSQLATPATLDTHPWTGAAFVRAEAANDPALAARSPGYQLAEALARLFRQTRPDAPPRQGKRLDTRWGAFGLLAAHYFVPFLFGQPAPDSLREAWSGIDRAILLMIFGSDQAVGPEERIRYQLVGNEPEAAPYSTVSDWHRKGLERLLETILQRERVLNAAPTPTPIPITPSPLPMNYKKWLKPAALTAVVILLLLIGWKAWNIYRYASALLEEAQAMQALVAAGAPNMSQAPEIAGRVSRVRQSLSGLRDELGPFLWLAPLGGWIPGYGGEISQAGPLLDLGVALSTASDDGLQTVLPMLAQNQSDPDLGRMFEELQKAEPRLLSIQVALAQAQAARSRLDVEKLSPRVHDLLVNRVDPLLQAAQTTLPMEDAIVLAREAPKLMGVGDAGPKTYLLLIQNEDEIRATGGFLTAVGTITIQDGKVAKMSFKASELLDVKDALYPPAPWQLADFMDARVMRLRNANWFTDYPYTVIWVKYLYGYVDQTPIDGLIAIDQEVVARILRALGPIRIEDSDTEINADNIIDYMRSAKKQWTNDDEPYVPFDRKQFIGQMAKPLMDKILQARGESWSKLLPTLLELLDERHILLHFENAEMKNFLARRRWDGAVRPPANSDFLLMVNNNVGFNKTNAVLDMQASYQVDLSQPEAPQATLSITYHNRAPGNKPCTPRLGHVGMEFSEAYPMDECHWNYLRLYTPAATKLTKANPQEIASENTLLRIRIPARVDDLQNDRVTGAQAFGTLLLIPEQQTRTIDFSLALPVTTLERDLPNLRWVYRLTIQKQAGMRAIPFTLRVQLPAQAQFESASLPFTQEGNLLTLQFNFVKDQIIEIRFKDTP